jgi:hypothetical protein
VGIELKKMDWSIRENGAKSQSVQSLKQFKYVHIVDNKSTRSWKDWIGRTHNPNLITSYVFVSKQCLKHYDGDDLGTIVARDLTCLKKLLALYNSNLEN